MQKMTRFEGERGSVPHVRANLSTGLVEIVMTTAEIEAIHAGDPQSTLDLARTLMRAAYSLMPSTVVSVPVPTGGEGLEDLHLADVARRVEK